MRAKSAKSKDTHTQKGLRLAVLFCIFVVGIIAFSALIRAGVAFKSSTFSNFRYNILVTADKPQIVSFSKEDGAGEKVRIVSFNQKDLNDIFIPINARVETKRQVEVASFKSDFISTLFKDKNNVPVVDKFKILVFIMQANNDEIGEASSAKLSKNQIEAIFKDSKISEDGKSIQIVNASGIPGLGNRLANVITTIGGNVVLVTSEERLKNSSVIEYKEDSTTANFLFGYLGFLKEKKEFQSVADVMIILGKDSEGSNKF